MRRGAQNTIFGALPARAAAAAAAVTAAATALRAAGPPYMVRPATLRHSRRVPSEPVARSPSLRFSPALSLSLSLSLTLCLSLSLSPASLTLLRADPLPRDRERRRRRRSFEIIRSQNSKISHPTVGTRFLFTSIFTLAPPP